MAQMRAYGDEQQQQESLHGHGRDKDGAGGGESNKKARASLCGVLRERKVLELARAKQRLVEVPYTATLANAANVYGATTPGTPTNAGYTEPLLTNRTFSAGALTAGFHPITITFNNDTSAAASFRFAYSRAG
jgi:hypothetical protein